MVILIGDVNNPKEEVIVRHGLEAIHQGDEAWRVRFRENKLKAERVWFDVIFGWKSADECAELRQSEPRLAP